MMFRKQALLAVDVQPSFAVPDIIISEIIELSQRLYTIATVERHDETITPFERQLGWKPGVDDETLICRPCLHQTWLSAAGRCDRSPPD